LPKRSEGHVAGVGSDDDLAVAAAEDAVRSLAGTFFETFPSQMLHRLA